MAPVNAHFTLGNLTSTAPYRTNDFDPHYNGVIGYVWPGAGSNSYFGEPNSVPANLLLSPGYQSPYPCTSGGVCNPPGAPSGSSSSWYQLASNAYAPFGAILVGSTGDLIFAINATKTEGVVSTFNYGNWSAWDILIPPEFTGITSVSQVVSTVSNDYNMYRVYTLSADDRYAPGWTLVRVAADGYNGRYINFTGTENYQQWYYVRINGVTAPTIAGRYFFKMLMVGNSSDPSTGQMPESYNYTYWVPPQNWPVVLVKGEIDPAIITGTIMYGGFNQTLYGTGVQLAGEVYAKMTTKLDPYTNQPIANGALTNAVGYFNETAGGHYEVEGLAPGVYDIYASVAGYPQAVIASGVTVLTGQSLHFNGYVNPGVVIHGTVYSKHSFGDEPFPYSSFVHVEIYNQPTVGSGSGQLASGLNPVSWSPLPSIAANDTGTSGIFTNSGSSMTPLLTAYWPADADTGGITDAGGLAGGQAEAVPLTSTGQFDSSSGLYNNPVAFPYTEPGGAQTVYYDPQGVGPATVNGAPQVWYTTQGASTFTYQFGLKGEYGAPTGLTGEVPQIYATWVNGLTPGRYYVRVWIMQYVQTQIDGATFREYYFDVAANEWAGDVSVPMDLLLGSYVVKTVHFHDTPGTLTTQPVSTGASVLTGELVDAAGNIWAHNVTDLYPVSTATSYPLLGIQQPLCTAYGGLVPSAPTANDPYATPTDCSIVLGGVNRLWNGRDYGIPAGVYKPEVAAAGYVQQTFDQVALSLSGTGVFISNHLYRGVGFNVTAFSIDFEQPRVDRNWQWPGQPVYISIQDSTGTEIDALTAPQVYADNQIPATDWTGYDSYGGTVGSTTYGHAFFGSDPSYLGTEGGFSKTKDIFNRSPGATGFSGWYDDSIHFESGQYTLKGYTYGYIQNKQFTYFGQKGEVIDGKINLIIGANLTVTIDFKKEHILSYTPWNMSMRVRVFDDSGNLVGEYMTSDWTKGGQVTGGAKKYFALSNDLMGYNFVDDSQFGTLGYGNYVPAGTKTVTVHIAGIDDSVGAYGDAGDPIFAPNNYGLPGSPDYTGAYTVEVDFVNWYNGASFASALTGLATGATTWYPPPMGLLEGESFHTVPGSPAGPFGYTGTTLAANHLGPYGQEGVWSLPNAHESGEASGIWEVDQRGYIGGGLTAFTWSNERRPVSWATFSVAGASLGNTTLKTYSIDGTYDGFLPGGSYQLTITEPGYTSFSTPFVVTEGEATAGLFLQIQRANIPIPEFSGLAVVLLSTLAASLYILRRRRL